MKCLEVSGAVRLIYRSSGALRVKVTIISRQTPSVRIVLSQNIWKMSFLCLFVNNA